MNARPEPHFRIRAGLNLPIPGVPDVTIEAAPDVGSVAVLGPDYLGLKASLKVKEYERVRLGQTLIEDRANDGVRLVSPAAGRVASIQRGPRRALLKVEIALDGDDEQEFHSYSRERFGSLGRRPIVDNLIASGLWTSLRTRPYSRVPQPADRPHSIFVPAMDTNPLAAPVESVLAESPEAFVDGLTVLGRLCDGPVYVCCAPGSAIPLPDSPEFRIARFSGPHPAGLVGTHIHFLDPVSESKTVWHVGCQDVIAIGRLFTSGRLWTERIVALGGPVVRRPRLLRIRLGAHLPSLLKHELVAVPSRVVSGSVLAGRRAAGWACFLGRYHQQISVLPEGGRREFLGWIAPGSRSFSATRMFLSRLLGEPDYDMNTSTHGSPRAMVPTGQFEQVMPLDLLPTPLLKALIVDDTETAIALGCLELDEEDLALCSFVCSGKYEYGPLLRRNLDRIHAEVA